VATQLAEKPTATGTGRGSQPSHYFCPGCALLPGGRQIRALCGYTTHLRRPLSRRQPNDDPPPANACIVCRELHATHPSNCPKETP
jgi:hypothetical protein